MLWATRSPSIEQNASNDIPTCATICSGLVADDVDLILANATPALQAAATATDTIPVLGTAVTEYGVALDIENFDGTVGGNVSGTSDLAPLDQQAAMLLELLPDAKTVGILYCSAEANSVYQAQVVQSCLEEAGVDGEDLHLRRLQRRCHRYRHRLRRVRRAVHPHRQHRRFLHRGH